MVKLVMDSVLTPLTGELLDLEHLREETALDMLSSVTYENIAVLSEQGSSSHSPSILFAQTGSAVAIILALTALVRALAALIRAAQD